MRLCIIAFKQLMFKWLHAFEFSGINRKITTILKALSFINNYIEL